MLFNVECDLKTLEEIETAFKFNDAVLRSLVMKRKKADTAESPLMKIERESKEKKERDEAAQSRPAKEPETEAAASAPTEEPAAETQE